jgi:phage/plasmid-associated DNA primase
MESVFWDTAPGYYEKGLPVIPLYRQSKRPVPVDWSRYHDHAVEGHQQEAWLNQYADGNIGMIMGRQAGMVMLDIDTEDPDLVRLILDLLPASPWKRVGRKGMALAFRYNGQKTFRIKSESGEMICEMLSDRTQLVLPPSIHPDTGLPYTANCNLLDVLDKLNPLNLQIEQILRGALGAAGVQLSVSGQSKLTDFVSSGSRDINLTEKAGLFAYAVMRGERSVLEAIGMLRSFNTEYVEAVVGDDVIIEKHVDNLLRFLRRDVIDKGRVLPEGWDAGLTDEMKAQWSLEFDGDQVEWDFGQMRTYLSDAFDAHDVEGPGRTEAIDKILKKLAVTKLGQLDEERLLQYITDVSGTRLRLTSLRRRLVELRSGELAGTDHSQIAVAALKDLEAFYEIRMHNTDLWKYTGSHWEALAESEVLGKISSEYGSLDAARRHSDHKGILGVMKNIAQSGIKDSTVSGVNFANGCLTSELELIDHNPDHGMTYTLPFRYLPEEAGSCRRFFEFLEDSWGEDPDFEDKKLALQEALCVTLFGIGPQYQRAILSKGVPKSGKSQLLKIAQSLVPAGAKCFVPPSEWADKFLPTQMNQKLINVCGELSEKRKIDGQAFKDIIDGAEMSGQLKGKDIFKFKPMCTHWFASNHSPKTDDTSEGFNRRWLILEFNTPISAERRITDLGDIIVAEEREAIVAWAVLAMPRLLAQRDYTLPASHRQLIKEVAQENNSVRFFMEEGPTVRLGPTTGQTSEANLYKEYFSFCLGPGGARPVTSRAFRAAMRELQHQLGFQLILEATEMGAQEAFYRCVTLVVAPTKKKSG